MVSNTTQHYSVFMNQLWCLSRYYERAENVSISYQLEPNRLTACGQQSEFSLYPNVAHEISPLSWVINRAIVTIASGAIEKKNVTQTTHLHSITDCLDSVERFEEVEGDSSGFLELFCELHKSSDIFGGTNPYLITLAIDYLILEKHN